MNAKQLRDLADDLFSKKRPLDSLWQELAQNFYPERADFTVTRSLGTDFASDLMTSYPILCRRDLAGQFSSMLRPSAAPWFHVGRRYEQDDDNETKRWLQWFEETQRRAMYDQLTMFARATSEGDNDIATFGQCAISVEMNHMNPNGSHLLYRSHHLRDMCWQEDETGQIGTKFRKWKPTAQTLARLFKGKLNPKIVGIAEKRPFEEIECMHMVVPADMYDDVSAGRPRWSIWYDCMTNSVIEATPIWGQFYRIPRWQTVSGSQYSFSPATVAALPDARLIQAMTYTLLEAGEKAANPPVIATQDVVRSDIALYAGGITWVSEDYNEKMGNALRPLDQDFRGLGTGIEMNKDTRALIHKAFFLDTLTLPVRTAAMTAYEVSQHVQEYIRNALPLFGPMEMEYNAALCEESFDLLWRNGAFGPPQSWPQTLRGADIEFSFESPLHDAIGQQKTHKFQSMVQLLGQAVAIDPSSAYLPKFDVALRDALDGDGVPAKWMNTEAYVSDSKKKAAAQASQQQTLANMETASNAAKNLGSVAPIAQ